MRATTVGQRISCIASSGRRAATTRARRRPRRRDGLMQIKYSTARGLGYRGTAAGLLDPNTNLTWGVRYLAGAYRYAQGDQAAARVLYGTGY